MLVETLLKHARLRAARCMRDTMRMLLAVVAFVVLAFAPAASGTIQNPPGGPILVVTSSSATFGSYYAEILRNEGLNEYAVADIGTVTDATLTGYDVVILAKTPTLTSTQIAMFTNWVTGGGNLIAMSPDPGLASLLGIDSAGGSLANGYLLIDTTTRAGNGLVGQTIQIHDTATRYTLNGASSIATLYSDATTATANPAVTLRAVGNGQAAAFAYDLATSIVYTRQGDPAWATQERDGLTPIRSDDKYFGDASNDPQPDWVNLAKVAIPQADEQQRLLANLIVTMNLNRKPLPRFWYFPNGKKAVVIMTGDDHGNGGTAGRFDTFIADSPAGCNVANWECVRGTSYVYPGTPLTDTQASSYTSKGFEVGLHVSTNCADFTSSSDLDSDYVQQLGSWTSQFPSIPQPSTNRVHCIVFSDWSSEPQIELKHGMRLDANYYYWPPSWINDVPGVFTGSAMPQRFAALDGSLLDVYQATTQMTDESGQTYPFTVNTLLDNAVGPAGYFGAFTVNAHTDQATSDVADAVVASAQARGVPIVSSLQMLNWLDGRNSSSFGAFSWSGGTLGFTITQGSNTTGLQAMLPTQTPAGTLATVSRGDTGVGFTVTAIKGIQYAMFPGTAGSYVATYVADTTPPTVTSTAPANGATDVNVATAVKATFSEALDPSTIGASTFQLLDATGTPIPATISYDASSLTATLTPSAALNGSATYTAKVVGGSTDPRVKDLAGNALAATFTWSFTTAAAPTCPCSAFASSATPANPSVNDPTAVELGVKFTSDVGGTITGLRFYKGTGNTGTHVGHLWTSAGTLLGSVTFTNETATGWQQANFATPITITANTVYVASYFTSSGNYAADSLYFANAGVDNSPLHLLKDGVSGGDGVYVYGASGGFPTQTFNSTNYWVDVVFTTSSGGGGTAPTITSTTPPANATGVSANTTVTATFSEAMDPTTITGSTFTLTAPASGGEGGATAVSATVTYNTSTLVATLTPSAPLTSGTTYTATVAGGAGGVKDTSGNALASNVTWSFTTQAVSTCPCSVFSTSATPGTPSANDSSAVEVGVKFQSDVAGTITGIRFYKGTGNTGTHVGNLWTTSGQRLASATFTNETASGWQQVTFTTPVTISANTIYVASYFAPVGHYAADAGYFATAGVDAPPLHLLKDGASGGDGVFTYAGSSSFPTSTFQSTNYWVDVVFSTGSNGPFVTATSPANGATSVSTTTAVTATFSEAIDPATINASTFQLNSGSTTVAATVSYNTSTFVATLTPNAPLAGGTSYTATIVGGANGVKDTSGNALASNFAWAFSTGSGTCAAPANAIVAENCLPGNPSSQWDVSGSGDSTIQGFATDISVDRGSTINFKIDTNATSYHLDIYRMGYYGGMGARYITTVNPSVALPQTQPNCITQSTTGLVDCGNWAVSASWAVPANATSGIYFARAVRDDTGGASHIVFVVRDDSSTSSLFFQTSDTTWEAYNTYGGNSLYTGGPGTNPARAYKVSYNRPFVTRDGGTNHDWVFNAEYPMVRWLESNGYDVSYTTGLDSDRNGNLIKNHKVFMSVGHDEYWSGGQRTNVENARAAGVNLAFFSGNEIFWKTRWENSIDGSNTPYRTLVSYKETHANKILDPSDPPTTTATWMDVRFGPQTSNPDSGTISPTADGGRPGNALAGSMYLVNDGATTTIQVPPADGKMRFWRNTSIATESTTATLTSNTLGYEWDSDLDNGFRPAGVVRMSTTVVNNAPVLQDYGSTYGSATATHYLTLYRHPSGALVFGAGSVQWSWGLDANHDGSGGGAADPRMQQATVNLFADMGAQPATLQTGLVLASASTDSTAPTSVVTSPAAGSNVGANTTVTVTGTATDTGGGVVGGVEVSTDGGSTWHPASGRGSWTYAWTTPASGSVTIKSRAVDDSGNIETPGAGVTLTVGSGGGGGGTVLVGDATVHTSVDSDAAGQAEAFQYTATASGTADTMNLYVDPANGAAKIVIGLYTDTGSNVPGTLLAQTTINAPTSGWNSVALPPTSVLSGTRYWIAVLGPSGAGTIKFRDTSGGGGRARVSSQTTLTTLPATFSAGTSYADGPMSAYASQSAVDRTPPTITAVSPANGAPGVPTTTTVTATFSEAIDPATISGSTFFLIGPNNTLVAATVSYNSTTFVATLTPSAALAGNTTYQATIKGGASGVKDLAGNALAADMVWSFTTAAADTTPPTVTAMSPTPGATGVATSTSVTATFSEAMDSATLTSSTFFLSGPSGTISATVSFNATTFVATLKPAAALTSSATYTATVKGGASGVKDLAGNALTSDQTWQFTTQGDTTPPTVKSTSPASGATGVSTTATVTATFSEALDPTTINGATFTLAAGTSAVPATVSYNSTTFVATLTPSGALSAGTTYTATISGGSAGVKDLAGNALASNFTWSFTTAASLLVGNATIQSSNDSNKAGQAEAFLYTASASGSAATLNFYVPSGNAATRIVVGVYTHNATSNAPATLLAQATINAPAVGWNTVGIPATTITSGTKYWIAVLSPSGSGTIKFRDATSGGRSQVSSQTNLTTLPASWSSGKTFTSSAMSAYASP